MNWEDRFQNQLEGGIGVTYDGGLWQVVITLFTRVRFPHDNQCENHSIKELQPDLYAYSMDKYVSINSIMDSRLDGGEMELECEIY